MFFQGVNILTVTAPAASYNLIDLATLKADLGITITTDDAFLTNRIASASATVANFCNRVFPVETLAWQFFPARDGWPWTVTQDIQPLELPRWPVVQISSVVETIANVPTTLVAGTDYLADNVRGQLTRLDIYGKPRRWWPDAVAVAFSAGYSTVAAPTTGALALPADVFEAVELLVKNAYYARTRDGAVRSENIPGVISNSYFSPDAAGGIPADVAARLNQYRVPVVA